MRPWLMRAAVGVLLVALGVVIGAGPLQRSNTERDRELAAQKTRVGEKNDQIDALESATTFAEAYAAATAPTLLRGALNGRSVALVTLPGAEAETVSRLRTYVGAAGGKVTTQVDLAPALAKASSRQLVEALTSQMLTSATDVTVAEMAGGYQRFGALLARAIGTGPTGQPVQASYDAGAVGIVEGLQSADLVTLSQPVSARAGLALVVTGPAARTAAAAADNAAPAAILQALGQALPTVVLGPTDAAGSRGVIGALRAGAGSRLSTVDSAETTMGQVIGVLALAARARGTVGSFGAVDAKDGALPGAAR